jgi:hypothetical protein
MAESPAVGAARNSMHGRWAGGPGSARRAHVLRKTPNSCVANPRIRRGFQAFGLQAVRHPLLDMGSDLHKRGVHVDVGTRVPDYRLESVETFNGGNLAWN